MANRDVAALVCSLRKESFSRKRARALPALADRIARLVAAPNLHPIHVLP